MFLVFPLSLFFFFFKGIPASYNKLKSFLSFSVPGTSWMSSKQTSFGIWQAESLTLSDPGEWGNVCACMCVRAHARACVCVYVCMYLLLNSDLISLKLIELFIFFTSSWVIFGTLHFSTNLMNYFQIYWHKLFTVFSCNLFSICSHDSYSFSDLMS